MMQAYFKSLYRRTMRDAYAMAIKEIAAALSSALELNDKRLES